MLKKIYQLLPFLLLLCLPIIIFRLKTVQNIVSRAFYTPARINVNSTKTVDNYFPNWLNFAQGGEEPGEDMIAPALPHLKKIKPRYIRLDHIFDDAYYGIVRSGPQGVYYDFSLMDKTVASILAAGAKPMLVLSYMPSLYGQTLISLPDNWADWQNLVKTTVLHYSGINYQNISEVYYEVWNEPDLENFGSFKYYGDKNYLDLYYYSAAAVKNLNWCNTFKLGGPVTTALYKNWITALLDFCQEKKLPLGFLSYHQYSYSPDDFAANAASLHDWLKEYPSYQNLEIILSEWGPDPAKAPIYNTNAAAAFTLSTASALGPEIDKAFAFEIKDGPDTSSWGIISHQNQGFWLKPRYVAFAWLSELDQALSLGGNGSFVRAIAGKNENKIVVIISNFDPSAQHQELIPLRISNLEPGNYQIKRQFLGETPIYEKIILESSLFSRKFLLPPNSVYKIELTPL